MGLYCTLKSATFAQLTELRANSDLLPMFYDPEHADQLMPRPNWFARFFGRRTVVPEVLKDQSMCMEVDLDKTWDGLNYLLTRVAPNIKAAAFLKEGGTQLSRNARALSPEEVATFRELIHAVSNAQLRAFFDPAAMTAEGIYPKIIWEREGEEAFDWLSEFHQHLWAFLRDAVAEGHGCVIWIS